MAPLEIGRSDKEPRELSRQRRPRSHGQQQQQCSRRHGGVGSITAPALDFSYASAAAPLSRTIPCSVFVSVIRRSIDLQRPAVRDAVKSYAEFGAFGAATSKKIGAFHARARNVRPISPNAPQGVGWRGDEVV